MEPAKLKNIVEAALLAADEPLTVDRIAKLFRADEVDEETLRTDLRDVLKTLTEEAADRGYELARVASGYRYQVRQDLSPWISRLWEEKPPRYTRALLETLALVAYKQPVTRGDIEQVRGVSVSQNIMRTLLERGWIRVVGQREVPGRPSMYGTTREFLDYFGLKSLDQLPPLAEIRALIEPLVVEEPEERLTDAPDRTYASESTDASEEHDAVETDAQGVGQTAAERAGPHEVVPVGAHQPDDQGDDFETTLDSDEFDAELAAALEQADAASARFRSGAEPAVTPDDSIDGDEADTDPSAAAARAVHVVDVVTDLDGETGDTTSAPNAEQPSAKVLKLPSSSH
jgi:segregation and condensation protein B